jgi:predicted AlkP superfamily phosphohydrolase/phosphomutase/Flp pilus assembly protein TadD
MPERDTILRAARALGRSLGLIAAFLCGCRSKTEEPAPAPPDAHAPTVEAADVSRTPALPGKFRRVIWIGLDGADWDYMTALTAAGKLPNWSKLTREGYGAKLESFVPLLSPIVWTTQETGVGPEVHRVLDFQELDSKSGLLVPVSEASRKVPAVWNVASSRGRKVGVVGFWATHPAEKINGFFLSDRIDPSAASPVSSGVGYPEALDETVRRVAAREGKISAEDLRPYVAVSDSEVLALPVTPSFADPVSALSALLTTTRITHRLSRELYDSERPDFLAVYFKGTDEVGHLFAPYAPPRLACTDPALYERFHRVPETYFAMIDAILGQWMRRALEDGAVLLITSDHGFRWGTDRPCGLASSEEATAAASHRMDGVLLAWGDGVRPAPPNARASAFDVAPTLLALMELPADREMRGSVVPIFPGLSGHKEPGVLAKVSVETVASAAVDREQAAEYTKKLVALGYISAKESAEQKTAPRTSAGLTKGAWNNLGIYRRFSLHDDRGAREDWEESLKLDPGYRSPLFNIATLERDRGHFEEAARWLLRAIAAGQPEPEGTVERWAGEFERRGGAGLVLLRAAHAAYPQSEPYARNYALLLSRKKRCREAYEVIAPLESSNQAETLNVAGVVEACLDRPDRVRTLFTRSLELDPNQPRVREALASLPR